MLKVGLAGVGGISGAHIPVWDQMDGVELVALFDIRPERMKDYPGKHCYTDFEEMLKQEDLDILDICLPTFLHTEYAVRAMDHGIHVLCEKPVSLHEEDVARIYAAAEKNHVRFMVAQVLRFWPEYDLLKHYCDSRKFGRVLSGSMYRLNARPRWSWDSWMQDEQRSGLVPYDLHVHDLDFLIYAFGNPKKVCSFRAKQPNQDLVHAVYEYEDFFVSAEATWYASPFPFSAGFRFQFEHAVVEYAGGKMTVFEENGDSYTPLDPECHCDTGSLDLPGSNAYANEIQYFTDCVRKNRTPDRIRPEQLVSVIHILNNL